MSYRTSDPRTVANVRFYGAFGDDTTDDTVAIQSAITAAGTAGYAFVPPGTYRVAGTLVLSSGQHLVLDANATLHRHVADAGTPLVRITGLYGLLAGQGTLKADLPIPNGIVYVGPSALNVAESIEFWHVDEVQLVGSQTSGFGDGSVGIYLASSEPYISSGNNYQGSISRPRIQDVDEAIHIDSGCNAHTISGPIATYIGRYFIHCHAIDGYLPPSENSFFGGFVSQSINELAVIKCENAAYNLFYGVQGEPGAGKYYDIDGYCNFIQVHGHNNCPTASTNAGTNSIITSNGGAHIDTGVGSYLLANDTIILPPVGLQSNSQYFTTKQYGTSTIYSQLGTLVGGSGTNGTLYLGNITPSSTNYSLYGDGSATFINVASGGEVALRVNNTTQISVRDGNTTFFSDPAISGGGVGIIGIANATSTPISSPVGGALLYAVGGALAIYQSNGTFFTITDATKAVTWSNDLSGSTNANQYVASISGSGGAGGVVTLNTSGFQFASAISSPTISQTTAGSGATPQNIFLTPQAPNAGASTTILGTPGSVVVNAAVPVSTGNEAGLIIKRNNITYFQFGAWITTPATFAALYMGANIVPGANNWTILSDGTGTVYYNGYNAGILQTGTGSIMEWSAAGILPGLNNNYSCGTINNAWSNVWSYNYLIPAAAPTPTLEQSTQVNGGPASQNLVIQPQQQVGTDQGTSALNTPGSLIISLGIPFTTTNAGNEATFQIQRNGSIYLQAGKGTPTGGIASSLLWLPNGGTPSNSNFALASDNSTYLAVNAPAGTLYFEISDVGYLLMNSTALAPQTTNGLALGQSANQWGESYLQKILLNNLTLRDTGTVTTTNATITTVYTEPAQATSTTYDYVITVIGQNPANGDMYRADWAFNYQRIVAAAPTVVGGTPVALNVRTSGGGSTWSSSISVSGNSVIVQVTGALATTIDWVCDFTRTTCA